MKVKKLAIAMGLLAIGINTSVSAETFNMFEPSASGAPAAGTSGGGTVVGAATYNANINGSINEDSSLTLNLDALGESVTLDVISVNSSDSGVSYSATSANMDVLSVTSSNGVMMGSLNYNGNVYKFKPGSNGDTLIVEMAAISEVTTPAVSSAAADGGDGVAEAVAPGGTDDGAKNADGIDVIIAYTQDFVSEFDYIVDFNVDVDGNGTGGEAADVTKAIEMYTAEMMSDTNQTFDLSLVDTKVNVVHSYPTSYSDSGNFSTDKAFFKSSPNSTALQLRTLRDTHEADIMLLMTGNNYEGCGTAGFNVQGGMEHPNKYRALAIVTEACGTGFYGFAQQLGTIFGAEHDQGFCGNGFNTIMANNCPAGARFPFWSSDTNTHVGNPTGSETQNNSQILSNRVEEVANFRFTPAPIDPPSQPTLTSPVYPDQININDLPTTFTWATANPDFAASYILEITDTSGAPLNPGPQMHTLTPAQANCAGDEDTTCEFPLPVVPTLPIGTVKWSVTAVNASGETSSEVAAVTVVDIPVVPDQINLIGPESGINTLMPMYEWTADSRATWYQLWVNDATGNISQEWYTMSDVSCPSGTGECSKVLDVALSQGNMPVTWWVRGWNNIGPGDWSEPKIITSIFIAP